MLVMSRKKNEQIVINDVITIVVVEVRGDKVRIGVEAPKGTPVHRREVYDAIKRGETREPKGEAANVSSTPEPTVAWLVWAPIGDEHEYYVFAEERDAIDKHNEFVELGPTYEHEIEPLIRRMREPGGRINAIYM